MKDISFVATLTLLMTAGVNPLTVADDSAADSAVEMTSGDWQDLQRYIAEQRGRVVVVDVWSTSCVPCIKEFPELVKLQKAHPKEVVCVSFCVDYVGIRSRPPERYRERAEKFLQKQYATFRNYLCTTASDELFDQIDLNSIPAAYVYGRDGKQAKRFDASLLEDGDEEPFTYKEDINPFVEKLLKDELAAE